MVRFLLVLALVAAPAGAQTIYRWTDAKGVVHYSDDPSTAPKGVKVTTTGGAELMEIKVEKPTPANTAAPRDEVANVIPVPPPPGEVDDEEYWRNAFQQAREKVRQLEADLELHQKAVDDPTTLGSMPDSFCVQARARVRQERASGLPGPYRRYPYGSCWYGLKLLLPDDMKAVERAKEELSDLERRAANAAVPLEWRR